ncbi:MAG: queuosine precursor transporter [Acidimicrobiia bacterium]|nr:queuosine precursor transporter [Acidimicrobiia bacterium]
MTSSPPSTETRVSAHAAIVIALLAATYVAVQVLSDVSSIRLVEVFGKALDGGTFIYPITFTLRDLIHKVAGKRVARAIIVGAAAVNLFMAALFWALARMPGIADGGAASDLFGDVLAPVWRIVFASIIAEVISELIDTEIYSAWVRRFGSRNQWGRVLASNGVALPIDSVLFAVIAFAGVVPASVVWEIIWLNIAFKGVVTVASIPLIYAVRPQPIVEDA